MHALVVSPFSTHPRTQGNAARIHSICSLLKGVGYWVHFLYYPLEANARERSAEMSRAWDFLWGIPGRLPNTDPTLADGLYAVDDWWDPRIGERVRALDAAWQYDLAIVNYVWFSAALDWLPGRVRKVLDTHDVFADRHVRAAEAGMEPNWFHTSRAEEAKGLGRADIVLAIQEEEAAHFREVGAKRVETVGYVTEARFLPPRPRGANLRVGYMASGNPWNVRAFELLHQSLAAQPALAARLELVVAGPICAEVQGFNTLFAARGVVPDVAEFYRDIDVFVNPMLGGTGLKIKTIEALGYGVPVLSTRDGSVGVASDVADHKLASVEALLDRLAALSAGDEPLEPLRAASRRIFRTYTSEQVGRFGRLFAPASVHSDAA